jgi:hypothetical protein
MEPAPAEPVTEKKIPQLEGGSEDENVIAVENGTVINPSGYRDQLKRQYGLLGLAGIALTVDNAWIALGSSISVSIREFSPPPPPSLSPSNPSSSTANTSIIRFLQSMVVLQVLSSVLSWLSSTTPSLVWA